MGDANSYLIDLDKALQLKEEKREKIERSIAFIQEKVWGIFQDKISSVKIFGSYSRDTFIEKDSDADIDVLVVFKKQDYQSQTYLSKIMSFASDYYPRSVVYADHPTIAIELEHLKFEIVPGIFVTSEQVKIPAPKNIESKWILTNPTRFKIQLEKSDRNNRYLIKPTVRILKFLNCINDKLFDSFDIERQIANTTFSSSLIKDYFYQSISSLEGIAKSEKQKKLISELKTRRKRLKTLETGGLSDYIETELKSFLPMP
ncbi:nucleotidyltransferase domain-containing protein [Chitinophagaceae bacterium 26-R-25]|nr:nucleotidyltransferase domain-containing protein [Chitinophagaceae bacterium 26-R-25]